MTPENKEAIVSDASSRGPSKYDLLPWSRIDIKGRLDDATSSAQRGAPKWTCYTAKLRSLVKINVSQPSSVVV